MNDWNCEDEVYSERRDYPPFSLSPVKEVSDSECESGTLASDFMFERESPAQRPNEGIAQRDDRRTYSKEILFNTHSDMLT